MNKKHKLLTALLVLGLSLPAINGAFASNSLVNMDVKKASQDTVDFTIYTSNGNNGNPIVRRKSDNKYVVLIPGISSSAISAPDFHSVKDIITDVDIKSVRDTAEGYTKVTVITKKPLNIRTKTVTSAPVTPEQKEYRSLLATANTPKVNSANPAKAPTPVAAKIEPPKVADTTKPTTNTKKFEVLDINSSKMNSQQPPQMKVSTNASKPVVDEVKKPSLVKELKEEIQKELTEETPIEEAVVPEIIENTQPAVEVSLLTKIKNKWDYEVVPMIPAQIPVPLVMVLIPLLGLIFMFKLIKASVEKSKDLRAAFVDKVMNGTKITKRYADITGDETLSWREKYQKYNEAVQNPEKYNQERLEKAKRAKYAFIKANPIDEKRENLEKMLNPIEEQTHNLVNSEDEAISGQMSNTVRLKAFEKPSLKTSSRKRFNNRFENDSVSFEEQKTVELGSSALHTNMRKFNDANLSVFDVEEKNKSIKDLKRQEELRMKDYEMSSLNEFFSIMENTNDIKMISTPVEPAVSSTPVEKVSKEQLKENVESIDRRFRVPRPYQMTSGINLSKAFENPFAKNSEIKMISKPKKEKSVEDLKVISNYEIDENHGFMMVSMDGKSALIGKANDEVTVLKEFDSIVETPLQVRKDRENVYLVKTEGFKSLVEINEDKMGVLIELE